MKCIVRTHEHIALFRCQLSMFKHYCLKNEVFNGKILFYVFDLFSHVYNMTVKSIPSQVKVYLTNFQIGICQKRNIIWKNRVLYFRLVFSYRIILCSVLLRLPHHPVYASDTIFSRILFHLFYWLFNI